MAVREYIGMRYVTKFADPIQWDDERQYEHMTVVQYQGGTYVSKQMVPVGIPITDTNYWLYWADFNAQIEQYRQEVRQFDQRITDAQGDATDALTQLSGIAQDVQDLSDVLDGFTETGSVSAAITAVDDKVELLDTNIDTRIDGIDTTLTDVTGALTGFSATNQVKTYIDSATVGTGEMVIIGDSFTSTVYVQDESLWYHAVADSLKCTPHCYAERGAGFARSGEHGNTFSSLLATAVNDSAFDNADVEWCFVYGGLNDIDHDTVPNAITNNFPAFCQSARTAFPNAKIVVMGINAWADGYSLGTASNRGQIYYERLMHQQLNALGAGVIFVSMSNALGFNSAYYSSSNNHPNANGHKVIASWVLSNMFGSGMCHTKTGNLLDKDGTDVGNYSYHLGAGYCEYAMQSVRASIDVSTGDGYMKDDIHFIEEGSTAFTGNVTSTEYGGSPLYGYLGTKDDEYYLHHTQYGWARGIIRW